MYRKATQFFGIFNKNLIEYNKITVCNATKNVVV